MREIKFRAWDKRKEQMLQDVSVGTINIWDGNKEALANECEFMQYTGLKDKNGKEIYEGDICKNGDWEEDAKAYNYRTEAVEFVDGAFIGWNYNIDGMTCKVIGNIYENPELLS